MLLQKNYLFSQAHFEFINIYCTKSLKPCESLARIQYIPSLRPASPLQSRYGEPQLK